MRGQNPPRRIGLPDLDGILLLPRRDLSELIDQIPAVEEVAPDRLVRKGMFLFLPRTGVDQGEEVWGYEDRNPLRFGSLHDPLRLFIQGVPEKGVQLLCRAQREVQVEAVFLPPSVDDPSFLLLGVPGLEGVAFFFASPLIDLSNQKVDDSFLVFLPPCDDLIVQPAGMALHPLLHLAPSGNRSRLLLAQQGEEMNHLLGNVGMDCRTLLLQKGPEERDRSGCYFIRSVFEDGLVEDEVIVQANVGKNRFTEPVEVLLPVKVCPALGVDRLQGLFRPLFQGIEK